MQGLRVAVLLACVCGVAASAAASEQAPAPAPREPARAPSRPEPAPDADLQRAKQEFQAAQALFGKGQYEQAAARFLAAYGEKPLPAFLFNAAVSFEKAKLYEKAKDNFEVYLAKTPDAPDAAQVRARIQALEALLPKPAPPSTPTPKQAASVPKPAPAPDASTAPIPGPQGRELTPSAPAPDAAPPQAPAPRPDGGTAPGAPSVTPRTNGAAPGPPSPAPPAPPAQAPHGTSRGRPSPPAPPPPATEIKGVVIIDSTPPGATVYLDEKRRLPIGRTPWQGSLPSRAATIIIEAEGFRPEARRIVPRSDAVLEVFVALTEEPQVGWVEIVSNVPGASVFIDRQDVGPVGRTPYAGYLAPGRHTVRLEQVGYSPAERTIDVEPGSALQYRIDLEAAQTGWISVAGPRAAGARLYLDERLACEVPCRLEVAPGRHEVRVEKDGLRDYKAPLEVARAAETEVTVDMVPPRSRAGTWIAGIAALGLFGGGVYVGGLSDENRNAVERDRAAGLPIAEDDPRLARGRLQAIVADVLFVAGGVAGVAAVVSLFARGPASVATVQQRGLAVAPHVLDGGAGAGVYGRF